MNMPIVGVHELIDHPLIEEATRKAIVALETEGPPKEHAHSRLVLRRWWDPYKWWARLRYGNSDNDVRIVRKLCDGEVVDDRKQIKVRTEWDMMVIGVKVVAAKEYRCTKPCIPGASDSIIRYSASIVSQIEIDRYRR